VEERIDISAPLQRNEKRLVALAVEYLWGHMPPFAGIKRRKLHVEMCAAMYISWLTTGFRYFLGGPIMELSSVRAQSLQARLSLV
jgi:hypothetical protein